MMTSTQVAFLGPEGTFTHVVARQRYPQGTELIPQPSIPDVFEYVEADPARAGLVPIENSSGGTIVATVDRLIDPHCPLVIMERLSLNVKLALLGHNRSKIETLYSHFAPLQHCETWLRANLPGVARKEVSSTAEAAHLAAGDKTAAALAARDSADFYDLKVLEYPVEQEVPNVTQFVTIARKREPSPQSDKTSLVVELANRPGALHAFITPLSNGGVNLTRIVSRPVRGQPNTYMFFVEIDGTKRDTVVADALAAASRQVVSVRIVGEYEATLHYEC